MSLRRRADSIRYRSQVTALLVVALVMFLFAGLSVVFAGPALAQPSLRSVPSDPRAQFFDGNVTSCAEANFAGRIQMGSTSNTSANDANLTGTVKANAGTINTGEGQEVNIAINAGASVVIDAVVVKGANGYNVYSTPAYLPPTLLPDQHYISPLTTGGRVPQISHWFVCYHFATPPPAGSLSVFKTVIAPDGVPLNPLPSTYTADVSCSNGFTATVTFSAGGGASTPITGIPLPAVCTVIERTASLPIGTVVGYSPAGAETNGVTITAGTAVGVAITNDFTAIAVQTGSVQLTKAVTNPSGVVVPQNFTARVVCTDGTDATVTMPGTGGAGAPVLHPRVGATCGLEEVSVPAGWTVTYSVDLGPVSIELPVFIVLSPTQTITVTITNTAPTTTTSSSTTTTTGSTTTTTTASTTTTTGSTTTTTGSTTTTTGSTTTTTGSTTTTTGSTTTTTGSTTTTTGSTTTTTAPPTTTTTTTAVAGADVSSTTVSSGSDVAGESLAATGRDPAFAIRIGLIALAGGGLLLLLSLLRPETSTAPRHRKQGRRE